MKINIGLKGHVWFKGEQLLEHNWLRYFLNGKMPKSYNSHLCRCCINSQPTIVWNYNSEFNNKFSHRKTSISLAQTIPVFIELSKIII